MSGVKIMHIISGLHVGGAEMMLYRLLLNIDQPSLVISLTQHGELTEKIRQQGVEVIELERASIFSTVKKLLSLIDQHQPKLIQSWLYRADLIAGIAGRIKHIPVIWNVRQTQVARVVGQNHIWLIQRLNALLSYLLPKQIVYCAEAAKASHVDIGFSKKRAIVISNGVDTQTFFPNNALRSKQRQQWNIDHEEVLIGMVGRFDPLKNHSRFLRIIDQVIDHMIKACPHLVTKAVLVGRGINQDNTILTNLIAQYSLEDYVLLIDEVEDVVSVFNGLDMHILTSDNEGWPNVIGEALSVGLPCVATDVGDVASILIEQGTVFSVDDESGFANAVINQIIKHSSMSDSQRQQQANNNHQFAQKQCSLQKTLKQYDDLYSFYLSA